METIKQTVFTVRVESVDYSKSFVKPKEAYNDLIEKVKKFNSEGYILAESSMKTIIFHQKPILSVS